MAALVLSGNGSLRSDKVSQKKKKRTEAVDWKVSKAKKEGNRNRCWLIFFALFVSACNDFQAVEPSPESDRFRTITEKHRNMFCTRWRIENQGSNSATGLP